MKGSSMADSSKLAILLLKTISLLGMVVLSYAGLLWICHVPYRQDGYLAANLDKMRLLKATPSPKLVFIGGSNLAFGLDSAEIKKAFAVPVVNMGLQGGLGLKYLLDQATPYLKWGDIVVVVPEYEQFVGTTFWGQSVLIDVVDLANDWSPLEDMPVLTLARYLLDRNATIFHYPWPQVPIPKDGTRFRYARWGFNLDGDETSHLSFPSRKHIDSSALISDDINHAAISYLHDFIAMNATKGITTLVACPCLMRSCYLRNATIINAIAGAIDKKSMHARLTPEYFIFNDDLFFDTVYHLNKKGREQNTEKMIRYIKTIISQR